MPELKKSQISLLLNKNQERIFSDDVVNTILQHMKNRNPPSFFTNCSEVRGTGTIQNKSMTHPEIRQIQEQSFGRPATDVGESRKVQLRIPLVQAMLQVCLSLAKNTGWKKTPCGVPHLLPSPQYHPVSEILISITQIIPHQCCVTPGYMCRQRFPRCLPPCILEQPGIMASLSWRTTVTPSCIPSLQQR